MARSASSSHSKQQQKRMREASDCFLPRGGMSGYAELDTALVEKVCEARAAMVEGRDGCAGERVVRGRRLCECLHTFPLRGQSLRSRVLTDTGQVVAVLLSAVHQEGGAHFCHGDEQPKVRYGMLRIVRARRCDMAQSMLRSNAIIFFLCFVVCVVLIGIELWKRERGRSGYDSKGLRSDNDQSTDVIEVVEIRIQK